MSGCEVDGTVSGLHLSAALKHVEELRRRVVHVPLFASASRHSLLDHRQPGTVEQSPPIRDLSPHVMLGVGDIDRIGHPPILRDVPAADGRIRSRLRRNHADLSFGIKSACRAKPHGSTGNALSPAQPHLTSLSGPLPTIRPVTAAIQRTRSHFNVWPSGYDGNLYPDWRFRLPRERNASPLKRCATIAGWCTLDREVLSESGAGGQTSPFARVPRRSASSGRHSPRTGRACSLAKRTVPARKPASMI